MDRKIIGLAFSIIALAASAAAQTTVTTSGTTSSGTVPVFNGTATVTNSPITVSGSNVGIGTTSPGVPLQVNGSVQINNGASTGSNLGLYNANTNLYSNSNINFNNTANATANSLVAVFLQNNTSGGGGNGEFFMRHQLYNGTGTYYNFLDYLMDGTSSNLTLGAPNMLTLNTNGNTRVRITSSGNVGIGTTSPAYTLDVAGTIHSSTAVVYSDGTQQTTACVLCGGDYAEAVDVRGDLKHYEPGDVLVLGSGDDGEVEKSSEPYSTMVTGIFATKPGVIGRRKTLSKSAQEIPMAMVGIVPTKVSAENGPIHRGDLLVSSSTPGYAMKGTDRNRMLGAVIGKAMGTLDSGTGVIEVVVTLQ